MNQKERAERAIELLKEAVDCLDGSGGYAPVYNPEEKDDDWLPTPENINALPEPIRKFIHDIETNTDPQGLVRENVLIKDTCKMLALKLEEKQEITKEFVEKWEKVFPVLTQADIIFNKNNIKQMLKEAGVKVVKK